MYIADDADIGMAEDCRALIFIDRDYKPGLAYAGDMLGCSPDAQRDVKPGRNRAARQADLLLFRQPALVGNVTRGANGGIEQARQLIDRLVVFRPSQAHTHADNRVGRFQLSHPRILELEAQAACADPRGDVFRWESFNNRFAAGVGDGGMEHAGAQRRHRRDGMGEIILPPKAGLYCTRRCCPSMLRSMQSPVRPRLRRAATRGARSRPSAVDPSSTTAG